MRVFKPGSLISFAIVAFVAAFSNEIIGQDARRIGGGSGITVFEDRNFRGDAATYENDVSNLPSSFNNRISSIRVGAGEQWQICDQPNYRGQCVNVSGEESDLDRNNWDNRISSLRRVSGGGGWGGGGGQTITPPSWAQGVFYGRAPDGSQITLTVSRNGSVNANINGAMSYGTFTQGNYLNIGGAIARVTRQGNGILTSRTDSGERISYSRSGWGDGGGGGGNPGNQISPPGWARGTFYGSAPDGSRIMLTISSNGAVTVEIGGNMSYGSFTQGNVLSINGAYARVTSTNRGIRTVRTDTGETINYRR